MVIKSMTDMVDANEIPVVPTINDNKEDAFNSTSTNTNGVACDVQLKPSSADFPKLAVRSKAARDTVVRESEKILDERVVQKTEEFVDERTGETRVRTVEYVEKLIEKEVETVREKIISLELTKPAILDLDLIVNDTTNNNNNNTEEENENDVDDDTVSEPPTPTTNEDKTMIDIPSGANKKRRRKRSKKGKH